MDSSAPAERVFNTSVSLINGSSLELPVSSSTPLFVVGPNGAGKSGLISILYRMNLDNAIRISAHRQTWMSTNAVPFSPQDKVANERNLRSQDGQPSARWSEWNTSVRSGMVISNLLDMDNQLARDLANAYRSGDEVTALKLLNKPQPLAEISDLFNESGIPIQLTVGQNSTILASKNGGQPYSIALLSDGERAALLIAGTILTAESCALVLVDEPERHLHPSIVTPLLLQLFTRRSDCTFVISTHELSLPVAMPSARSLMVRDSISSGDDVTAWDVDLLEPGTEIDDATKEAIIGSRRKMLFIEGTTASLDKPLYELLFPGVSIFPRQSCRDVEHAVASVRDAESVTWVQAFGIVDQDQIPTSLRPSLNEKGIYPLSVYSVESLYYSPAIISAVAERQCTVIEGDPAQMVQTANVKLIAAIATETDRLAARMTEQAVKDKLSLQMPDWKAIRDGETVNVTVDAQKMYDAEKAQLEAWIAASDVENIVSRYPIRETMALTNVVNALQFKSRSQYEAAVRKLAREDADIRSKLIGHFGDLVIALT